MCYPLPKRLTKILIPQTCDYDFIYKECLCRCDQVKDLKMTYFLDYPGGPKFGDRCPYKRKAEGDLKHTDIEGRRPCEGRQREVEVMQPQTKEQLEPPEAGRGRDHPFLETSKGVCPYQHPNFRSLASKTVRKISAWVFFRAMQCVITCHGIHRNLMHLLHLSPQRAKLISRSSLQPLLHPSSQSSYLPQGEKLLSRLLEISSVH